MEERNLTSHSLGVLEISALELQLMRDDAVIGSTADRVIHAEHEVSRMEVQHKVCELGFNRLNSVSESQPGLVAQQEVDDAQGRDLTSDAQIESAQSSLADTHRVHASGVQLAQYHERDR